MKWDQRPGCEPDDTWNYERKYADDEQPTVVHPAILQRCRGPQCGALLYRGAARQFCEPCERLWKLRNAVACGELSDWEGVHHVVGLDTRYPFPWQELYQTIIFNAMGAEFPDDSRPDPPGTAWDYWHDDVI